MTADNRGKALEDPTAVLQDLYRAHTTPSNFARFVADYFARLFESRNAFRKIPTLNVHHPPASFRDRTLVRFRAMVQDTSLSTEMYLSNFGDGLLGGWGLYQTEEGGTSTELNPTSLQQCSVLWATSIPAETRWCADELDDDDQAFDTGNRSQVAHAASSASSRAHKYPHAGSGHLGIQVKIYDRDDGETFKSTDIVTFVGILSTEPCGLYDDIGATPISDVPTLHVLFAKLHAPSLLPRPFPRVIRQLREDRLNSSPQEIDLKIAQDTAQLRNELIAWVADEALGGDQRAAEWVLFSCLARVQSRHPPLLPPPVVISNFPPPPPVSLTGAGASSTSPLPTLSAVLSLLLPLTHTLPLSLDCLNKSSFTPESKDEDLHAGVLQLPRGTVLLVSEAGVREGKLFERGVLNVRALQEVIDAQSLAYIFPFSQFSFPTDITCVILAEGRKSAFFKAELNVPLTAPTGPDAVAALYKAADRVKMPAPDQLEAFRDLVVGARYGKVQVPEATSEYIQAQFVRERQEDGNVTADDLIRWMSVSKLYALSLHEPTLSVDVWARAKALDDQRRALVV